MEGQDPARARGSLFFVFQDPNLLPWRRVAANVDLPLMLRGDPAASRQSRVAKMVKLVGLEGAEQKYPWQLSGGMRMRVSIARALVDKPPIIFYDSPTAGLDPVTSQTIITLILRGRDLQDVTSLLATHRVQDAFGLANYCFDKTNGRVEPVDGIKRTGASVRSTLAEREKLAESGEERNARHPTTVLVLREGKIYFEGAADAMLGSTDEYIKKFLASAE